MVASMTGYGKADLAIPELKISVEIRTVNSKYLDLKMNMPDSLLALEPDLRNEIQTMVKRGRADVRIQVSDQREGARHVQVDYALAQEYRLAIEDLAREIGRPYAPSALDLIAFPSVLSTRSHAPEEDDEFAELLNEALRQALENLDAMRRREGEHLLDDLRARLETLTRLRDEIEQLAEEEPERIYGKLQERIRRLFMEADIRIDENRLLQEAALLAEKRDVHEELARLESHFAAFALLCERDGPAGKEMDFLVQEMMRESNTLASKSGDAEILRRVIRMKSEIEKVREQVQNIE